MPRLLAATVLVLCTATFFGCSAFPDDPVFVGPSSEEIDCADGDVGCLRVYSEVDGDRHGTGSCILYATTGRGEARVAVAASGELELVPGMVVEWVVRVPSHLGEWNPACVPTAEG